MSDFVFNASALGMGGVINHAGGSTTIISSVASVALAPTGGEGSSLVENYSSNGISFARAESRVVGFESKPDLFTTYTDIFVTGLSVFERFKVALMQVTMTSTRHVLASDSTFDLRAIYRGVEADGEEIIPAIDLELCNAGTYADFTRTLESNVTQYAARLDVPEEDLTKAIRNDRQPILGAIVSAVHRSDKSLASHGNKLTLENFGTVRFGEFLVKPGRRRINLLRFTFGKDGAVAPQSMQLKADAGDSGSLTIASVDGNGVPVWPHS
jgi:hypothetical protein